MFHKTVKKYGIAIAYFPETSAVEEFNKKRAE
jgi:hypothetical protein